MKVVLDTLKITFLTIGTIIGAGFISGRELVRFFGGSFLLPACFFTALLFGGTTWLLLAAGKKYGGEAALRRAVFGKLSGAVETVLLCSSLVIVAGMLAGIDSLMNEVFSVPKTLPLLSAITLIGGNFVCKRGVEGLSRCNLYLVPVMLVVIVVFLARRGAFAVETAGDSGKGVAFIVFYCAMNLFLATPVMIDAGVKFDRRAFIPASVLSALLIGLAVFLILGNIEREGASAMNADMPLLYLFSENRALLVCFSAVVYMGIVTTHVSSYYPLYLRMKKGKRQGLKLTGLMLASFGLSRFGLGAIVDILYPVLGFVGFCYMTVLGASYVRDRRRETGQKTGVAQSGAP